MCGFALGGVRQIFVGKGILGYGPMKILPMVMVIGRGVGGENCEAEELVNHRF